jgi:PEGA domain
VDVLIDAKHFRTDNSGLLTVGLTRGTHTITVQSPGYNTFTRTVEVSGRAVLVERFIKSLKL